MDGLRIFLIVFVGVVSGSELEVTVRPGDNITLYCDCKKDTGVYVVWYRNCSHVNQPHLVLKLNSDAWKESKDVAKILNPFPRFHFLTNESSKSYDLLITNVTGSDEGLYYCGTENFKFKEKGQITQEYVYQYGNKTRIKFDFSGVQHHETPPDCRQCWMLLFCVCPALALLSCSISSVLAYYVCQKTAKETEAEEKRSDTRGHSRGDQDEDVWFAALEILQALQKPKKRSQSLDFSTYSAIRFQKMNKV